MSLFRLLQCATAVIFAFPAIGPVNAAVITSGSLARPEGAREYLLAHPVQPAAGKHPLVIVLHGHGGTAAMAFGRTRINDPAAAWLDIVDRESVLVIAPDGWKGSDSKQGWNDCRADAPTNPGTDDIGFIAALIDKAVADYDADPERIYITGISNGGGMTYRAAIELGPRLAAVAVLSALMPTQSRCAAPAYPLPVLITHGTNDKVAPYAGGVVSHWMLSGRGSGISTEESVKLWRNLAALPDTPVATAIPHRNSSDPTSATRYVWGQDASRMQVVFLKIDKGGHAQPSISRRFSWLLVSLLGEQNGDIEFTEEAWSFFKDKRVHHP